MEKYPTKVAMLLARVERLEHEKVLLHDDLDQLQEKNARLQHENEMLWANLSDLSSAELV